MGVEVFRGFGVFMVFFIRGSIAEVVKEWYIVLGTVETAGGQPGILQAGRKTFCAAPGNISCREVEAMNLTEALMLLTLLASVAYYTFSATWKIAHNDKKK